MKLTKIFACLSCCVAFCVPSAFAFTNESFVVDTNDYLFSTLSNKPMLISAYDVSPVADDEVEIFNYFQNGTYPSSIEISTNSYSPPISVGGVNVPGYPVSNTVESSFSSTSVYNTNSLFFYYNAVTIPAYNSEENNFVDISIPSLPFEAVFSLDLSSLGDFNSFDLNGRFACRLQAYPGYTGSSYSSRQCKLFVNGTEVKTFYGPTFDTAGYIYSGTSNVTDITFKFYFAESDLITITDESKVGTNISPRLYIANLGNFSMSVLKSNSVLDGYNGQAQNNVNEHNAIESQWTGSMAENFNKLNISDFSFNSGIISAFTLISGIFGDIWNALGEYQVVYVVPLTLGISLLVVGRISKFTGSQSSGNKRGDGDA